ncbi:MAG TPA: metal-dependent hydrolase [Symbiobacteriaceae bacterium]|nr:metal-dependent hydrolase [Symbiobacteriaceae bacterium]
MDNITHGLLGVAIGMLRRRNGGPESDRPLSDTDKAITWATLAAAELPDIDNFAGGPMDYLDIHRGWTHSLVAAPLIAAVATLGTKLIWKKARMGSVYLWSLAAVLFGHLFADWLNGWGTRLLLPFSRAKLGLDWVGIVDLIVIIPLAIAAWQGWRRPALRRRNAAIVLVFLAVYAVGYRGIAHTLATGQVARHYEGRPVARLHVSPNLFNPLGWHYAVDLGDRYEQGAVYPWGLAAPGAPTVTARAPEDRVTAAVLAAPELRPFFEHFKFPLISYKAVPGGYAVSLIDVRYRMAGREMVYQAELSETLAVTAVSQGF